MLIKRVKHHVGVGVLFKVYYHTHAVSVGFVFYIAYPFYSLVLNHIRDGFNQQGFVDAGECTEEQRKQLTEEITALTDKPENQACEAAENASDFNAVTVPNYMLAQMSERLAAIESASKADSADFDIVNELEYMLTQLREMLHNRFGEFRILAASAEDNSAVIKYRTADGLMKLEISRRE